MTEIQPKSELSWLGMGKAAKYEQEQGISP